MLNFCGYFILKLYNKDMIEYFLWFLYVCICIEFIFFFMLVLEKYF